MVRVARIAPIAAVSSLAATLLATDTPYDTRNPSKQSRNTNSLRAGTGGAGPWKACSASQHPGLPHVRVPLPHTPLAAAAPSISAEVATSSSSHKLSASARRSQTHTTEQATVATVVATLQAAIQALTPSIAYMEESKSVAAAELPPAQLDDAAIGAMAAAKAHHAAGCFMNPWPSARRNTGRDVFKMMVEASSGSPDPISLPVIKPNWEAIAAPPAPGEGIQVTWIGHASLLVQMDGKNILTDPIFSCRCSPVQFAGPKRLNPPACRMDELPHIDAVIISHDHYDHLDADTVKALRNAGTWFVPKGIGAFLKDQGVSRYVELDWWEQGSLGNFKFICTPCQHFSGRGLLDRDKSLWASWAVIGPKQRFYFGGDTGYRSVPGNISVEERDALPFCPAFGDIGRLLGPFDLAAIPIGAYNPRWFMSPIHCDPLDAVDLMRDIKAKAAVGIHWGTFVLTTEPITEPPKRLAQALELRGMPQDCFFVVEHGETRVVHPSPTVPVPAAGAAGGQVVAASPLPAPEETVVEPIAAVVETPVEPVTVA